MSGRHLKIKAELSKCMTEVKLSVLEQSHKGNDFYVIDDASSTNTFTYTHKGSYMHTVSLVSDSSPSTGSLPSYKYFFGELPGGITLYVNGVSDKDIMKNVAIPVGYFPIIKAAIEAYNEAGRENGKAS